MVSSMISNESLLQVTDVFRQYKVICFCMMLEQSVCKDTSTPPQATWVHQCELEMFQRITEPYKCISCRGRGGRTEWSLRTEPLVSCEFGQNELNTNTQKLSHRYGWCLPLLPNLQLMYSSLSWQFVANDAEICEISFFILSEHTNLKLHQLSVSWYLISCFPIVILQFLIWIIASSTI